MGNRHSGRKPSSKGLKRSSTSSDEELLIRVIPDHNNPHLAIPEHHHKPGKIKTPRYVFAHVVQGNFQFHEAKDWSADMRLAQQMGIDAVAINIGQDLTNKKQLPLIYEVVKQSSFHIFLSFDMVYYGQCGKAQFIYRGKPLVSTFLGEVPGNFLELRQLCLRKLAKEGKESPELKIVFLKDLKFYSLILLYRSKRSNSSLSISLNFYSRDKFSSTINSPLADGMLSWTAWCPVLLSQDHRYKDNLAAVGKQENHITFETQGRRQIYQWRFKGSRLVQTSSKKRGFKVRFLTYPWSVGYCDLKDFKITHILMVFFFHSIGGASATEDKMCIAILVSFTKNLQLIKIESGERSYYVKVEEYGTCKLKDVILLISIPF
ncbi:hypothetical protein MJO29_008078 [Puccinia striiformis f. sp. tritici]|nr:hypothetical protein MJO29_008078 [Puccinia striiformis f. sp. tritici]